MARKIAWIVVLQKLRSMPQNVFKKYLAVGKIQEEIKKPTGKLLFFGQMYHFYEFHEIRNVW